MEQQWISHLETSVDFYNHLPQKTCSTCGAQMDEQCESYETNCPSCAEKPVV